MLLQIIVGLILVGAGAILAYLAKFMLNIFLPKHADEKGILIVRAIGLAIVIVGAFIIFFIGIRDIY